MTTAPWTAARAPYPGAAGLRRPGGRRTAGRYPRPGVETWPAAEQSTRAKTAQGSRPSSGPARTAPELTSPEAGPSGRGSSARSREGPAVPGAAEREPEARGVAVLRLRPPRGGTDSVELVAGSGPEPQFRTGVRRKWWCSASAAGLWELGRTPTARRGPSPGMAHSAALLPPTQPSPLGVQSVRSRGGGGPRGPRGVPCLTCRFSATALWGLRASFTDSEAETPCPATVRRRVTTGPHGARGTRVGLDLEVGFANDYLCDRTPLWVKLPGDPQVRRKPVCEGWSPGKEPKAFFSDRRVACPGVLG